MYLKPLEELGLSPKEAEVYIALVSLKSASLFDVMGRAKVSRKSIYEILRKLIDKGLVSHTITDGKKRYNAASPERLVDILREKEASLQAILPDLLAKYRDCKDKTRVEVFVGNEGLKTASNNILKVGKPMYDISGDAKMFDILKYYVPQFIKKRVELNILRKAVYNESVRNRELHLPMTEIRYVPKEYVSPLSMTTVYGDCVNLIIYSEIPVVIYIQSKEIAETFMNYFNLMWALGVE